MTTGAPRYRPPAEFVADVAVAVAAFEDDLDAGVVDLGPVDTVRFVLDADAFAEFGRLLDA